MKTKTWKIGEYCKGGIITVEIHGKIILIIGKDWDFSAGTHRGSNQSKAKEWTRGSVQTNDPNAYHKIKDFLEDLTTVGWADTIMEWIESSLSPHAQLGAQFPWETS